MSKNFFSFRVILSFLVTVLILGSLLFIFTDLDLIISDLAFQNPGWIGENSIVWLLIYGLGPLPASCAFIGSVFLLMRSFLNPISLLSRAQLTCILLALIIGPIIVVNLIFKDNYGRPRPHEIERYGGNKTFVKVGILGDSHGESFPSGHASSGFVMTIFFFILYPRRKRLATLALGASLLLGLLLGLTRIVQGGHFASDILWAFGFTQLVNIWVYFVVVKMPKKNERVSPQNTFSPPSLSKCWSINALTFILCTLFLYLYLLSWRTFFPNFVNAISIY